jgi:transcription elongation factor Elf1
MKQSMKVIDASSGIMECGVCGSRHNARIQSGYDRTDGATSYYKGSYQCSNQQCPSNQKSEAKEKV